MIPLSALRNMLAAYEGWAYATDGDCRYPVRFADWCRPYPPQQTDCVSFVAGVVLGACELAEILVDWPIERHRQALLSTPLQHAALEAARAGDRRAEEDLYGPCTAMVAAGLAVPMEHQLTPPSWSVVQCWSAGYRHGHTVLVGDVSGRTVELHEASRKAGKVITRTARWPLPWTHQRLVALQVDSAR